MIKDLPRCSVSRPWPACSRRRRLAPNPPTQGLLLGGAEQQQLLSGGECSWPASAALMQQSRAWARTWPQLISPAIPASLCPGPGSPCGGRLGRGVRISRYENVVIVPADPIPDHVKDGQFELSGLVKTGADERERGTRRATPLRIDGSRGDWTRSRGSTWPVTFATTTSRTGSSTTSSSDIGEGTYGWEFTGDSNSVELR
ncbi:hypothetical protein ACFRFU_47790 [Streptomyces sp. NPDC056704]|uniref:hypothetical protein n=1 Tax=Streptomyces sp. NPDC056704 TaxID=3345917 RepID=UPI003684B16E